MPTRGQPLPSLPPLDPGAAGRLLHALDQTEGIPSPIPGYIIDRLVGEGGGGVVYRAFRSGSDRPVALKVMRPAAPDAAARAERELSLLQDLRLPALPRLIDYGVHEGRLYIAAEFIEGQTLKQYSEALSHGPESPSSKPDPSSPAVGQSSPGPTGGGGRVREAGGGASLPHEDGRSGAWSAIAPAAVQVKRNPRESVSVGPAPAVAPTSDIRHPTSDIRTRVSLLARIADQVQSLHEHGVIHRDLKPSNILITYVPRPSSSSPVPTGGGGRVPEAGGGASSLSPRDGSARASYPPSDIRHPISDIPPEPMLIDLGLAVLTQHDPANTLTADGAPLGTPAYMAPEQARGERARISTRTDVYSLGAIAYELLTGRTPHDMTGSIHEVIRRVADEPAREPRSLEPTLPKPLGAVLSKAVSRDPAQRYGSARDFAEDLRRWLDGDSVLAQPPGTWRRTVRWIGRHPVMATAAACVVLVLTSLAAAQVSVWRTFKQPASVTIRPGLQEIWLRSRANSPIRIWKTDGEGDARVAEMITLPSLQGGGRLLFLSGTSGSDFGAYAGDLSAFRLDDLDQPIWTSGHARPAIEMPREHAEPDDLFYTTQCEAADVFPDLPGVELVAVHEHRRYCQRAIRVYEIESGKVLYEAWHHGTLVDVAVMPAGDGTNLLIGAGISNAHTRVVGPPGNELTQYATVVFALRPELGSILGWINLTPRTGNATPPLAKTEWYKFVAHDAANQYVAVPPTGNALRTEPGVGGVAACGNLQLYFRRLGDIPSDEDVAGERPGLECLFAPGGTLTEVHFSDRALARLRAVIPQESIRFSDFPPWPIEMPPDRRADPRPMGQRG